MLLFAPKQNACHLNLLYFKPLEPYTKTRNLHLLILPYSSLGPCYDWGLTNRIWRKGDITTMSVQPVRSQTGCTETVVISPFSMALPIGLMYITFVYKSIHCYTYVIYTDSSHADWVIWLTAGTAAKLLSLWHYSYIILF